MIDQIASRDLAFAQDVSDLPGIVDKVAPVPIVTPPVVVKQIAVSGLIELVGVGLLLQFRVPVRIIALLSVLAMPVPHEIPAHFCLELGFVNLHLLLGCAVK